LRSFGALKAELITIVGNTCRSPLADAQATSFWIKTAPTASQRRACGLIEIIALQTKRGTPTPP